MSTDAQKYDTTGHFYENDRQKIAVLFVSLKPHLLVLSFNYFRSLLVWKIGILKALFLSKFTEKVISN